MDRKLDDYMSMTRFDRRRFLACLLAVPAAAAIPELAPTIAGLTNGRTSTRVDNSTQYTYFLNAGETRIYDRPLSDDEVRQMADPAHRWDLYLPTV